MRDLTVHRLILLLFVITFCGQCEPVFRLRVKRHPAVTNYFTENELKLLVKDTQNLLVSACKDAAPSALPKEVERRKCVLRVELAGPVEQLSTTLTDAQAGDLLRYPFPNSDGFNEARVEAVRHQLSRGEFNREANVAFNILAVPSNEIEMWLLPSIRASCNLDVYASNVFAKGFADSGCAAIGGSLLFLEVKPYPFDLERGRQQKEENRKWFQLLRATLSHELCHIAGLLHIGDEIEPAEERLAPSVYSGNDVGATQYWMRAFRGFVMAAGWDHNRHLTAEQWNVLQSFRAGERERGLVAKSLKNRQYLESLALQARKRRDAVSAGHAR